MVTIYVFRFFPSHVIQLRLHPRFVRRCCSNLGLQSARLSERFLLATHVTPKPFPPAPLIFSVFLLALGAAGRLSLSVNVLSQKVLAATSAHFTSPTHAELSPDAKARKGARKRKTSRIKSSCRALRLFPYIRDVKSSIEMHERHHAA